MSPIRHYTRNCAFTLALLLLGSSPALADEAQIMVLEGDLSAVHDSGVFTVIDPANPEMLLWWRARLGSPVPGYQWPTDGRMPHGSIAQAPIGPDGKFRLEIAVDKPRLVYFLVTDQGAQDSRRPADNRNSNRFILEPGELHLRMIYSNYFIVTGGHYNDAVYGSWRLSDEYRATQAKYSRLLTPQDGETEEAAQERFSSWRAIQSRPLRRTTWYWPA